MNEDNFVSIGKIQSAQGIKGELYIFIVAGEAQWVDQWDTLYVSDFELNAPQQSFEIVSAREHVKQKRWGFVVRLKSINDRNQAEKLVGKRVFVPESFLISDGDEEIYLREVLGFRVEDKTRGEVGEVVGFSGNDYQDLLVIKNDKGEFEVPFVEPIHLETDMENKKLIMDIPFGFVIGEEI